MDTDENSRTDLEQRSADFSPPRRTSSANRRTAKRA